nr:protein of unknown function (DUF3592) [uncultured bacterium]
MGLFDRLSRKRHVPTEQDRRAHLEKNGRITDGSIVDTETDENGAEIAYYFYSVHGVDFESSERLTEEQMRDPLRYAPGAKVGVRYDPKNHGNSILV